MRYAVLTMLVLASCPVVADNFVISNGEVTRMILEGYHRSDDGDWGLMGWPGGYAEISGLDSNQTGGKVKIAWAIWGETYAGFYLEMNPVDNSPSAQSAMQSNRLLGRDYKRLGLLVSRHITGGYLQGDAEGYLMFQPHKLDQLQLKNGRLGKGDIYPALEGRVGADSYLTGGIGFSKGGGDWQFFGEYLPVGTKRILSFGVKLRSD